MHAYVHTHAYKHRAQEQNQQRRLHHQHVYSQALRPIQSCTYIHICIHAYIHTHTNTGPRSKISKEDSIISMSTVKPSGLYRALLASLSKTQTGSMRAQLSLQNFTANTRPLSQSATGTDSDPNNNKREPSGDVVVVPSYASWFKFEQIHPIEKRAMSEWFKQDCVSKTAKTYVEARDLIINLYRESPRRLV